jgi:hypothetical protein
LIFEVVPGDPAREEYRQGNTMGGLIVTGVVRKLDEDSGYFSVMIQP